MRRIVAVIMVFLSILMISSSINVSSYNAKDRTFTVNIQYDSNLAVISPLYEEDYKKTQYMDAKVSSNRKYTVSCNISNATMKKNSQGLVTSVSVDLSDAKDLVINIYPESSFIYSRYFQVDDKYAYQTKMFGFSLSGKGGKEKFETLSGYPAVYRTWSTTGAYHYRKYCGQRGDDEIAPSYTICSNGDYTALCIKDISNPGKFDNYSFSVSFGLFDTIEINSTSASYTNFANAGNGHSTTSTSQRKNIKLTKDAVVSNNISSNNTSKTWLDNVKTAVRNFESLINIATMFYLGFTLLTSLLVIILCTVKLSLMPSHPIKRRETIMEIITAGICLALNGGITLITKLLIQIVFT